MLLFLDRIELVERPTSNLLGETVKTVAQGSAVPCRYGATGPQPTGPPGIQVNTTWSLEIFIQAGSDVLAIMANSDSARLAARAPMSSTIGQC